MKPTIWAHELISDSRFYIFGSLQIISSVSAGVKHTQKKRHFLIGTDSRTRVL